MLLWAAGAAPPPAHEAYVWQRQWSAPVTAALHASAGMVGAWRVLAGEDAGGAMVYPAVDSPTLLRTQRPVTPVFRLHGRLDPSDVRHVRDIAAGVARWQAAGLAPRGVEIDHDCPESQLARYPAFLLALRRALPAGTRLSITALPAWLGNRELPALLAAADEAVLQVHAVMDPARGGLFDAALARQWIARWDAVSAGPFRVALPNYGSRVTWNAAGLVTAIESEAARAGADPGEAGRELFAHPADVRGLLDWLPGSAARLRHFRGVVWFRLPTASDRRAWSLPTWRAVMAPGPLPAPRIAVELRGPDVVAVNRGPIDAALPDQVVVTGRGCAHADALPGYRVEKTAAGVVFRKQPRQVRLLRVGETHVLGWVRCDAAATVKD
ncbi:MAG: DUF3142 domain-containing protein [Bryobacterales bacterium]|nr:DUF3142 domain-containing protein [Bryobacterales bacterium]